MSFVQDHKEQTPSTETTQEQAPQEQAKPTFVVGDRTYDEEAAAKKIANADSHISTLEAELAQERARAAELEKEAAKAQELEKALQRKSEEATTKSEPVDVEKIIEEKFAVKEQQRVAEDTFKATSQALVDQFGAENVDSVVSEKMQAVGKTLEDAMQMAANPSDAKVLMALLGSGDPKPKPTFGGISGAHQGYSTTQATQSNDSIDAIWKSKHEGKPLKKEACRDVLDGIAQEMGFKSYDPKV